MPHDPTDTWLDVLAGKAPPTDLQTRQAAALRDYFAQEAQQTPALGEAAQRRILNALQAKGVFAQAQPPKPPDAANLLTRLKDWLFPQGHASIPRWSAIAAAVMAVAVAPLLVMQGPATDGDDPGTFKSLNLPQDGPVVVIDTAQPQQLADQLSAILARHGIAADVRATGADLWVQASIPADKQSAVQADLLTLGLGLAPSPTGQLTVQFRRQR
ncbi:MAG: hypothetical protein IPH35_10495 [Rhodoferax sp.]|nr:hypothetical protein [Rhodoferax sp.]